MKFLDESSLPPDLQGASRWRLQREQILWLTRLDPAPVPPLPIGDAWIGTETALALAHDEPRIRQALKKHSSPEALDRFAAVICRQLPRLTLMFSQFIAMDLGGPETARVLAAAMTSRTNEPKFQSGVAAILAHIGDVSCLAAFALAMFRMERGRVLTDAFEAGMAALVSRLGLAPADAEAWSVPDNADPDETPVLRVAQVSRLRDAMLWGRRWSVDTFERRIVRQPVVGPLAAGLVWGYFDDAGRLLRAFPIAPGREDSPPAGASVGIVHPGHLPADEVARWRRLAEDLHPPFAQWDLPAQALSPEEIASGRFARLPGRTFSPTELLCRLEALGWQRPRTRTKLEYHTRPFPNLGVRAVIRYSGIPVAYGGEWSEQSIQACYFEADRGPVPLSQVGRQAIGAVLADLEALSANQEARKK